MAIHRFKCSKELNDEIIEFSQIHKFDLKDNLIEQFDGWIETNDIKGLIKKEEEYLKLNEYDAPIYIKIFKSIKYYYIKKFIADNDNDSNKKENGNGKEKGKEKKKPVRIDDAISKLIQDDIKANFMVDRSFKPSDSYIKFLKNNEIEDEEPIKKSYKNHYYQIKNKKYYVNE